MRCLAAWAVARLHGVYLGDKSILRMRTRVSEGHLVSPGMREAGALCRAPHRYCDPAAARRNPRLQPLEKSYLLAGGWWLPPPGRVTQVQGQCPGRTGLGGGPGRGRRAAPSSRQLHGQQSSPPSDSVSGRAEPSRSEPGHGCGHGHWRCRDSVLHCWHVVTLSPQWGPAVTTALE